MDPEEAATLREENVRLREENRRLRALHGEIDALLVVAASSCDHITTSARGLRLALKKCSVEHDDRMAVDGVS